MLLAKTPQQGVEKSLLEHSQDVLQVFECLFGSWDDQTPLANCWRRFFGMQQDEWEAFFRCAAPTMLLHDLGKANSGFQNAVRRKGDQVFRHEHLSAMLLAYPVLHKWLEQITDAKASLVIAAIVGHHLQAGKADLFKVMSEVSILQFESEGLQLSEEVNNRLERYDAFANVAIGIESNWARTGSAAAVLQRRQENVCKLLSQLKRRLRLEQDLDARDRRLLYTLRAALIVADSAASGLTREQIPMLDWLQTAFSEEGRLTGSYVREHIINKRTADIQRRCGKFGWQDFQDAAASLPSRSLMLAPCGSGKTLAAWRWIEKQLSQRPASRVIFLYPTRATAREGFRDYVAWAPETDASLISGTAAWELAEGLFENPEDVRSKKDFTTEARLFAISFWHRRIFSSTVDQFLGFMQNSYASICLLPMLADSVVVIDEIHSFDRSLFAVLKKFLEHFDVPVLSMTASLPETRRTELEKLGLTVFPQQLSRFNDLKDIAEMPRYRVRQLAHEDQAADVVHAALNANACKILWVANTVARCQELAQRFAGPNTLCYHSAFTLADRQARHQEVVRRFQESDGPLLAVTTQVCEMSLDLDTNSRKAGKEGILITERAPITSLIQRMGRCNRHARPEDNMLGKVFIYRPENELPYSEDDLHGTDAFLNAINGQTVSQTQLQELLAEHGPDNVEPEKYAAFLECGPYATAREESLRDINDRSVQAVLRRDVEEFVRLKKAKKPTDGLLLPAPRHLASIDKRVGRFPLVVDARRYSAEYGLLRISEVA